MNYSILIPILYIGFGLIIGRYNVSIRVYASLILSRFIIPLVIIYNISTQFQNLFVVMSFIIIFMIILFFISKFFSKNYIENLCFCYLNVGWLGIPIATALFDQSAADVFIGAYVGSSLFGNSLSAGLLSKEKKTSKKLLISLKSPPAWSLVIGILCIPFSSLILKYGDNIYFFLKFLMSFLGLTILGMWLSKSKVKLSEFILSLKIFLIRFLFSLLFVFLLIETYKKLNLITYFSNVSSLYLLCILPPAANIIVLETYYLKTGSSAIKIANGTIISLIFIFIFYLVRFI